MFEVRLVEGGLLKKIVESFKDLVNDANFDCSATGFSLQAMDSSHVALVAFLLRAEGFDHYRCDRNLMMGMNVANMAKMLKCASNDDIVTIKADDGTDTVTFMFESPCDGLQPRGTRRLPPPRRGLRPLPLRTAT
ncbi:proliferating cell nuclear antigen [Phtheirospermum japonicum]|uniref:Proliferating cell nuclear antigen n=1 Tax=Phtheirospermum japonicum TaxID=374723 RepID=A0A830BT66_9LAMI|nr:proliferating cell nuclear antigen [Phtheirospermum japonicum]